jgi:hypothetical protein
LVSINGERLDGNNYTLPSLAEPFANVLANVAAVDGGEVAGRNPSVAEDYGAIHDKRIEIRNESLCLSECGSKIRRVFVLSSFFKNIF